MKITYDGMTDPSNNITLTGVPNILTIESDSIQGSKAELQIVITDLGVLDLTREYTININGISITSSTDYNNLGNRLFYLTNSNSTNDKIAVANSIVRALRNTNLFSYEVFQGNAGGIMNNVVYIQSKEIGELYEIKMESNLGSAISYNSFSGSTTDEFINSRICVDIYSLNDYITTLDKSYYKEKIDFNISQVLTSISRYDYLTPYKLVIYADKGNSIQSLGVLEGMYSSIGYMVNQGNKTIPLTGNSFALNVSRGTQDSYNKTTLYTFNSSIPFSVYSTLDSVVVEIKYLDSSKQVLRQGSSTIIVYNHFGYSEIALEASYFNLSNYIDITIPEVGTIRYNVIKPIDATSRCLRVYYHNSYGGVSFFDFTGLITENHKTDNDTYTKNIFDYYRDSSMELTKIYGKENSISVTMKSHLMERNAVWQFNDLLGSYDMWTTINGVQYKIIVTDCKVDETETGVWEATVTYTYSLI